MGSGESQTTLEPDGGTLEKVDSMEVERRRGSLVARVVALLVYDWKKIELEVIVTCNFLEGILSISRQFYLMK